MSDVQDWDQYLENAKRALEDGQLDRDEGYKNDLAQMVSAARTALLGGDENWPLLLKDAINDGSNILIDWRDRAKLAPWIDEW